MFCNICLEPDNLIRTCTCSHQAHLECITKWHSNIDYGKILRPNFLSCPQCKTPTRSCHTKIFKTDKEIIDLLNSLDKDWIYVLCPSCKNVKPYVQESCVNYIDTVFRLICDDCSPKSFKACPKCDVMIEKENGCPHMKCSNCETDFCWICLEIHDDIYHHIDIKHNSNTEHELQYQNYLYQIEDYLIKFVNIPEEFWTEELIKLSLKYDANTLKYLQQTRELCLMAVKHNDVALQYVDIQDNLVYKEICLEAVRNDSDSLQYVNVGIFSKTHDCFSYKEICLEAVKTCGLSLQYINNFQINHLSYPAYEEICLEAVKQYSSSLKYVIIEYNQNFPRYAEICLEAVKNNCHSLKYIDVGYFLEREKDHPNDFAYTKICLFAVKKGGYLLHCINSDNFSIIKHYEDICLEALKQDGYAIKYVKDQTRELCLEAVKQEGYALQYIRDKTQEICLEAMKNNNMAYLYINNIDYVADYIRDHCQGFFSKILKNDGLVLRFITNKTDDMCLTAVKHNGNALKYVENQTDNICLAAIKQTYDSLLYVKKQTNVICLFAVNINGTVLRFVQKQTVEICVAAVINNRKALKMIKPNLMKKVKKELVNLNYFF